MADGKTFLLLGARPRCIVRGMSLRAERSEETLEITAGFALAMTSSVYHALWSFEGGYFTLSSITTSLLKKKYWFYRIYFRRGFQY
jgi:hypothetical protein